MKWHVPTADGRTITIEATRGNVRIALPGEEVVLTPDEADLFTFTVQAASAWAHGRGPTGEVLDPGQP
jgi:hypothetical protein